MRSNYNETKYIQSLFEKYNLYEMAIDRDMKLPEKKYVIDDESGRSNFTADIEI
jgi:hypothetical protein